MPHQVSRTAEPSTPEINAPGIGTAGISASALRAAHDVRTGVGRLRRRLRETQDRRGLSPSQTSVLSRLDRHGSASASELAAAERVRPQSVAMTIGALEERGLVERRPDPTDGRRHLVSISGAGRAFLEDTRAGGEEWLARALQERLDEGERRMLIDAMALLERVADA
jgi:DNA-binding MarR family transcriptional regulator